MKRLEGQVALVTGGAGGIGGRLAGAIAHEGARVAVADRDAEGAQRVARDIGGIGIGVDVTDADAVAGAVDRIEQELGGITLLANVAGVVGTSGSILELPVSALDDVLAVNVRGTFLVTQAVARSMVRAGRPGAIASVSSAGAERPGGPLWHYGASKAALNALTRAAAIEFAPHGIRVNAVAPGPVYTPLNRARLDDPAVRATWEARVPLGRIAEVDDLIPLLLLLLSDESRYVTGAVLAIDGGVTAA